MIGFKESLWSLVTTEGAGLSVATPWVRVGGNVTGGFCYLTTSKASRQAFKFYYASVGPTVGLSALPIPAVNLSAKDFPSKSQGYIQLNPSIGSFISNTIRDVNIDDFKWGIALSLQGAWFGVSGHATLYFFIDAPILITSGLLLSLNSIRALTWQLGCAITTPDLSVSFSCQLFQLTLANKKPIRL